MRIFIASPQKTFLFILLIFIIQQLDGNVIGPKILGDSTGLSSLGVMVSILVMGGYFGFIGMFFGVPVFAVLCALLKQFIEGKLASRELPVETAAYYKDPTMIPQPKESETTHVWAEKVGSGCKNAIKTLVNRLRKLPRNRKK